MSPENAEYPYTQRTLAEPGRQTSARGTIARVVLFGPAWECRSPHPGSGQWAWCSVSGGLASSIRDQCARRSILETSPS